MKDYNNFDEIGVSISSFNTNYLLNDVIKLNNCQVCYISTSSDYTLFKFVTVTLYNSDKSMNIRYYEIKMWEKYKQKIYLNIKLLYIIILFQLLIVIVIKQSVIVIKHIILL